VWYAKMLLMSVYVRNRQLAEKGDKILALADAHAQLEARIERALAIPEDGGNTFADDLMWQDGYNTARDEFRAALTGNDEGDA
jgi:hypothetical protein